MSYILQKDQSKAQSGIYSVAGGHFTATPSAGTKKVVISNPGFAVGPANILAAKYWVDSGGGVYAANDIPIENLIIAGTDITFTDKSSVFAASDVVEIYIVGPDRVKAALDLIKDTAGIKKIVDDVTETNSGAIKTAVELLDNIVSGDRAKSSPIVGQDGVAAGSGASGVTVPRVVIATDSPDVTALGFIKTAVELIDDTVKVDNAAFTEETDKGLVIMGINGVEQIDSGSAGALKINEDRQLETAGHTVASDSNRVEEIDPASMWYLPEEPFDGSALLIGDSPIYAYVDMTGFKYLSIQGIIGEGTTPNTFTATIEGTLQDDGTAPASCVYEDITDYITRDNAADLVYTAAGTFLIIGDTPLPFKYIRVKAVTSAESDWTLQVFTKKMF